MGLLGSIAGFMTRVPVRIYTCRGLRYEHERGPLRFLLKSIEKVASSLSHCVLCVGPKLRDVAVRDSVFDSKKTVVIGKGASNGVDIERYSPDRIDHADRRSLLRELDLEGKTVYGFVGRIIDRKGINELYKAFDRLYATDNNVALLLLGRINREQLANPGIVDRIERHPAIKYVGFQENVPLYMSIFDVHVQSSWWEGFANALIQAASMGLPIVTTDGTGCIDAVSSNHNALVVPVGDADQFYDAMLAYHQNPAMRRQHGANGREWAKNFKHEVIWEGLDALYRERLN